MARSVTAESISPCKSGEHIHIGWKELNAYHAEGSLQPVDGVREYAKDGEGREPDYVFEWLIPGQVLRYKREIPYRGLSTKDGWYLAQELNEHRKWAEVARAQMRPHRTKQSKTKLRPAPREKMKTLEPGYIQKSKV